MTHKAQKKTTTATNRNLNPNLYQAQKCWGWVGVSYIGKEI
jgi:hypothetical protein